ncbi:monosaccharide ABC transporter membrane protein, CUT2 family [Longilinea arvoryzae]|uniref:Autoinducer 2 import system permease protein LsrD n=1 Tax=Longilinea arvoryzae TaxID=360412 RepID=A0A0S7B847_9CHLR|nr:monosaccharide ABC transporter membrane protein, CUT2 family [Longilinea arvoryzae]
MKNQSLFHKTKGLLAKNSTTSADQSETNTLSQKPQIQHKTLIFIGKYWAWVFLVILIGAFSTAQGFFSLNNFQAILANNSLLLVLALGQTFVIITGGIDLSTGWVMGLASVTASLVMRQYPLNANLTLVILSGFLTCVVIGLAAGFINGVVISRLKVPPFIATLGMYGIARGFGYILSGGPPVSVNQPGIGQFGNGFVFYFHPKAGWNLFNVPEGISGVDLRNVTSLLPYLIIYFVIALFIVHWVLSKTKFGQHVYAVGGSAMAALRAGIPVNRIITKVYMLSALMAGLAGFLYVMRYSGGVASAGDALNLNSIAAIVVGGASLMGGEGTLVGTLVGTLIIAVIQNGLIILGIDPFYQYVAVGVIIIFAVLIDQLKKQS